MSLKENNNNPLAELLAVTNDDGYSFERCPFGLQKVTYHLPKGYLLQAKRMPLAKAWEASLKL